MTITYRILSFLINVAAIMLAISLLGSISMFISSPQTLLPGFLMLAVILYTWSSFRFKREVLQRQQVVTNTLWDWIRVNGIATLIFSTISFFSVIPLLAEPEPLLEATKHFGVVIPLNSIICFLSIMLVYSVIFFVHILWTFALLEKNKEFFQ